MTINNNISNIEALQGTLLERISTGNRINSASDDASGLLIAEQLQVKENSLTQSLINTNQGIALTQIAQAGISNQKEILSDIRQEAIKARNGTTSDEGRIIIQNQIEKFVESFESIAQNTTYNDEQLLRTIGGVEDDLSIVGDDTTISITKSDSDSISNNLRSFLNDFTTNPNSIEGLINAIDEGINTLSQNESEFSSASTSLESLARSYINASSNTADASATILNADTIRNISDFNKNSLTAQAGYLAQSQANAIQSRTISLLT